MEDYGEPWDYEEVGAGEFFIVKRPPSGDGYDYIAELSEDGDTKAKRIVACVNAMAGIEDPAAFVNEVREAEAYLSEMKESLQKELNDLNESRRSLAKMTRSIPIIPEKTK